MSVQRTVLAMLAISFLINYNTIQYNLSLILPFFLMHVKLRSALSCLGGADAIVSRFHSCTTTRPPSSPHATVAPRYLPGLTFPDFDWHRNETRSLAIA